MLNVCHREKYCLICPFCKSGHRTYYNSIAHNEHSLTRWYCSTLFKVMYADGRVDNQQKMAAVCHILFSAIK